MRLGEWSGATEKHPVVRAGHPLRSRLVRVIGPPPSIPIIGAEKVMDFAVPITPRRPVQQEEVGREVFTIVRRSREEDHRTLSAAISLTQTLTAFASFSPPTADGSIGLA